MGKTNIWSFGRLRRLCYCAYLSMMGFVGIVAQTPLSTEGQYDKAEAKAKANSEI